MPAAKPSPRPGALAYSLRALGRSEPPERFELGGCQYRRTRIVKHDFWAATAFYESPAGEQVVAKINRVAPFCGIGMAWIGRFLRDREVRFYRSLADVENVPKLLGTIGSTGFLHALVPGRPLSREQPVPDCFFAQLADLFQEIHRRGIAYVDANKPQNILLGDDGRPHLIDFQISYDLHELGDNFLNRAILKRLQAEDAYHLLKHKRKLRPDLLTPEEADRSRRPSWFVALHRIVTRPYFLIRRRTMRHLRETGRTLPEGSK